MAAGDVCRPDCQCCLSQVRRRPQPAEPASDKPRRDRTCKGALTRVPDGQTLAKRGPGAAERPQARRGGDAAELAIHSRARWPTDRRFAVLRPRS